MLLGAVGGPKWSDPNAKVRPEQGLLALRKGMGLYANLRPVRPHPAALNASPIKPHLLTGVDMMVVRELTGGIYFGEKTRTADSASDLCTYSVGRDRARGAQRVQAGARSAAATWSRSTRPTCWKPRACGAMSPRASAATNSPT